MGRATRRRDSRTKALAEGSPCLPSAPQALQQGAALGRRRQVRHHREQFHALCLVGQPHGQPALQGWTEGDGGLVGYRPG